LSLGVVGVKTQEFCGTVRGISVDLVCLFLQKPAVKWQILIPHALADTYPIPASIQFKGLTQPKTELQEK
jgi:hypothetical protein